MAQDSLGGLTGISALVRAVRDARDADGGAVLLIDAGDMWQGTLESNLVEGASIVAAFNALDYDAVAVGNHEFDFGPTGPRPIPQSAAEDPRGALKQRALEADFPLLAANLIDATTGQPVDWPNVQPTTTVSIGGVKVGIIGVMSANALRATIAANVRGLRVAELAATVTQYAGELRRQGADLIIVTAHAGGRCRDFSDPEDVSSCDAASEIFRLARDLPTGLVDHIIAGHVHQGISHVVNDIAITSGYSNTFAISRVDFSVHSETGDILDRRVFAPQPAAGVQTYENRELVPDPKVVAIASQAQDFARKIKERKIGIKLSTPFTLEGNPESSLGFLFTQALLEQSGADIVLHNIAGGLRADLPSGDLTYNDVYRTSPFDNLATHLTLSGHQLRKVIARQSIRGRRAVGFAGMSVAMTCHGGETQVEMTRIDGRKILDTEQLDVLANDYLALGGDNVLAPIIPEGGFSLDDNQALVRDLFIDWLAARGGELDADDFVTADMWHRPEPFPANCRPHL